MRRNLIIGMTMLILVIGLKKLTSAKVKFQDIEEHWAQSAVDFLTDLGAIHGYPDGTFRPGNVITKAEFDSIFTHLTDLGRVGKADSKRVDDSSREEPLTRLEVSKIIVAQLKSERSAWHDFFQRLQQLETINVPFLDRNDMNAVDLPYIAIALSSGIISGYGDNIFKVNDLVTRAEAAVMLQKYIIERGKEPQIDEWLAKFKKDDTVKRSEEGLLDVPLIHQYPQLPTGCEVTALAMALQYYDVNVSKTTLADRMIYDHVPMIRGENQEIVQWGDPEAGYVGDPYGNGITINPNPLKKLADQYRSSIALYGEDFSKIADYVNEGYPTIIWFTLNYEMPEHRTWKTDEGKEVFAPRPLHTIVLTGVDDQYVYFNDSDANKKNVKVEKEQFIKVYDAMGRRALVVQ